MPLKVKLEPYLGFLHYVQVGKPSLVRDFQELYRYLIDDYLIERCQKLLKKDFVARACEFKTNDLAEGLNLLFDRFVEVLRNQAWQ